MATPANPLRDQLISILDRANVPMDAKADAWDAFDAAANPQEFRNRFDSLNVPKELKRDLWFLRFPEYREQAVQAKTPPAPQTQAAPKVVDQTRSIAPTKFENVQILTEQPPQPPAPVVSLAKSGPPKVVEGLP